MLPAVKDFFAMTTTYFALGDIKLCLGDAKTGLAMRAAGEHLNKRPMLSKSYPGSIRSRCCFHNRLLVSLATLAGKANPVILLVKQLDFKVGSILLHHCFRLLGKNAGKHDVSGRLDQFTETRGEVLQWAGKNIGQYQWHRLGVEISR